MTLLPEHERVKKPEESKIGTQVSNELETFLSTPSSYDPKTTAEKLTAIVEQETKNDPDNYAPHFIYDEILYRVRIVTHDDPQQEKLVELLAAIKEIRSSKFGADYWHSLDPLGLSIRELWNGELRENSVESWASLNAFSARLAQVELLNLDDYAIWAMRYSLEDGTLGKVSEVTGQVKEGELNPDVLDAHIPAAAVWIFYARSLIWQLSQKNADASTSTRGGPAWNGSAGYSVERWNFWKERLGYFSERDDLSEKTRSMAKRAKELMENVGQ